MSIFPEEIQNILYRAEDAVLWVLEQWDWKNFLIILGIAAAGTAGYRVGSLGYTLDDLKPWFSRHPLATALAFSALAFLLGSLASYWKRHAQASYGISEVAFGLAFAFNVLLNIASHFDFSRIFAVGSAVYVIARGLNNLSDARKDIASP